MKSTPDWITAPSGWEEYPVYRGGQKVAFFCVKENEIHCYRLESALGNWLTRQDLERLTAPIFAQFGHLITKVRASNAHGQRFVERLGFERTHEANGLIYYMSKRLKHARP